MLNQVEFWQQRWVNNQTGFHEGQVNVYLEKYISILNLTPGDTIFLPLCGKSLDITWLSELGFKVIGVECSEIAIAELFEENNLQATVTEHPDFKIWSAGNITIYGGDFYKLDTSWFNTVTAIFDRAALVALEQPARPDYRDKIYQLCAQAKILLVSIEYPQTEMVGPPFSLTENEVQQLYNGKYQFKLIESNDILAENDKFKERGLSELFEKVFLLTPE